MSSTLRRLPFRLFLVATLLAGAAFRFAPLTQFRFHSDEALFATLARLIASGNDPLLTQTALLVDKPPLFYYTLALSILAAGAGEAALKLPSLLASIISIALAARLAWRLWRSRLGVVLTAIIVAFSPFAILFSPTVFSDPQYMMWLLASCVVVAEGRWGWSGVLFGLAVACKQSASFFLPLILLIGFLQSPSAGDLSHVSRKLLGFVLGFGVILAAIIAWDHLRAPAVSFWVSAVDANNPGRLVRSAEVWPRASAWLGWGYFFTGSPVANTILIVLAMCAVPLDIAFHHGSRPAANSMIILAVLVIYATVVWFVAFPLLDRYLLPVVYLIALLAGRGGVLLIEYIARDSRASALHRILAPALAAILIAMLLPGSIRGARGEYPVGGDHGAYSGIDKLTQYVATRPIGTVVYARDLSWLLDYYLFDAYVYRSYLSGPDALARDLTMFGGSNDERYVFLGETESATEISQAVEAVGYRLVRIEPAGETRLRLYQLQRAP